MCKSNSVRYSLQLLAVLAALACGPAQTTQADEAPATSVCLHYPTEAALAEARLSLVDAQHAYNVLDFKRMRQFLQAADVLLQPAAIATPLWTKIGELNLALGNVVQDEAVRQSAIDMLADAYLFRTFDDSGLPGDVVQAVRQRQNAWWAGGHDTLALQPQPISMEVNGASVEADLPLDYPKARIPIVRLFFQGTGWLDPMSAAVAHAHQQHMARCYADSTALDVAAGRLRRRRIAWWTTAAAVLVGGGTSAGLLLAPEPSGSIVLTWQ